MNPETNLRTMIAMRRTSELDMFNTRVNGMKGNLGRFHSFSVVEPIWVSIMLPLLVDSIVDKRVMS